MKDYIRINTTDEAQQGVIDAGRMTPLKVKQSVRANAQAPLVAGPNITIDNTDPDAPVISATGGGGGGVDSVNGKTGVVTGLEWQLTAGPNISINRTNPEAPVISSTGGGGVTSVNGKTGAVTGLEWKLEEGSGISIDRTNPEHPLISSTGGGGAKIYGGFSPVNSSVSSSAAATKGCCITPLRDFSVTELIWQFNAVAGASYVARALQMNASGTSVSSVLGTTPVVVPLAASTGGAVLFEFSSPINLPANGTYALVLSRLDGGDAYGLPLYGAANADVLMIGFPAAQGVAFLLAKAIPAASDLNGTTNRTPFNLRLGGFNA